MNVHCATLIKENAGTHGVMYMQVVKQVHRTRERIRKEREPDNKNIPHVEPACCTMCHPSFRTKKGKSRAFTPFPKNLVS